MPTLASPTPAPNPPELPAATLPPPLDALVVGAGLTGLVLALRLRQAGLRVQVLEAGAQPGGVIASVQHQGCLFERGPNSAMDGSGRMLALIEELGLMPRLRWARAVAGKRYIWHDGQVMALPASPLGLVTTPLFSARAKWGLLGEPLRRAAPAAPEESIASFVRRRLGPEFLDVVVDPFVAGVYAGDPERIAVAAAFPKLHALEQRWGSLSLGALRSVLSSRSPSEGRRAPLRSFSFDGGLQVLTDALAAAVGAVATRTRALALQRDAQGLFSVQALQGGQARTWQARAVMLAIPAPAAAELLRPWAPQSAEALDSIPYAPVACVTSAYRRPDVAHPLDGFGCLLPSRARRRVLGVLFASSMFEGRVPRREGLAAGATEASAGPQQGAQAAGATDARDEAPGVLLSAFLGGQRNPGVPALPAAEIAALAHAEQADLLGIQGPPLWQQLTVWPQAIPQYNLGHLQRVAAARAAEPALPGLSLCGNWCGGVSLADCVANGDALGRAEAARLRVP